MGKYDNNVALAALNVAWTAAAKAFNTYEGCDEISEKLEDLMLDAEYACEKLRAKMDLLDNREPGER